MDKHLAACMHHLAWHEGWGAPSTGMQAVPACGVCVRRGTLCGTRNHHVCVAAAHSLDCAMHPLAAHHTSRPLHTTKPGGSGIAGSTRGSSGPPSISSVSSITLPSLHAGGSGGIFQDRRKSHGAI